VWARMPSSTVADEQWGRPVEQRDGGARGANHRRYRHMPIEEDGGIVPGFRRGQRLRRHSHGRDCLREDPQVTCICRLGGLLLSQRSRHHDP
jgi:hypothetical protein